MIMEKMCALKWDNGQIGDMIYDRNVCYNAFNLIPLKGEF